MPLSFHVPGTVNAGRSCNRAVSLLDIYPSLIELCGLPPMKGLEGISLLPQLEDPDARRSEPAVTTWYYNNHAVRGPRWRYIRYRDGSEELYNHATDPLEHVNQASNPKFAKIKERFRKYLPAKKHAALHDERWGTGFLREASRASENRRHPGMAWKQTRP